MLLSRSVSQTLILRMYRLGVEEVVTDAVVTDMFIFYLWL